MHHFTQDQLRQALGSVGLSPGDLVMIHSSLYSLGRLEGIPIDEIPSRLYGSLRRHLGPSGTIVVPTFNFEFCRGMEFDRDLTPSQAMGAFSEYLRLLPEAWRSPHPIQSVAAVGPLARAITERNTASAFARGSSFHALLEFDARLVLVGCGADAASLIHLAEEWVGVPYRRWKTFSGPYRDDAVLERRTCRLYARDLEEDPTISVAPVAALLAHRHQLARAPLGGSEIISCRARHFIGAAVELLRDNPRALVDHRPSSTPRSAHGR